MGMGAITWACLLLPVHQGPPEPMFIDSRAFLIPIRVNDPKRRAEVHKWCLWYSTDDGQVWQTVPSVPANQEGFTFRADKDGKYLFIMGEEDQHGNTVPHDPMRVRPQQCIVVDTQKPRVQVAAERLPSGEVQARWTVQEDHPESRSLRVEYHIDGTPPDRWTPLPIDPQSAASETRFNPRTSAAVRVRVQFRDRARNIGQGEGMVQAAGGGGPPVFGAIPTTPANASGPPGILASRQTPRPVNDPPPPDTLAPLPMSPREEQPMPSNGLAPQQPVDTSRSPYSSADTGRSPYPSADAGRPPQPLATGAGFAPPPRGALPQLRIVNKREVKIEFEVAKVGPSGLGGADVYVTLDEGAHWNRVAGEPPLNLPPSIDAGSNVPVRGSVSVQLPNEGVIYGFIVAVKSRAGLARPAPHPGEPPQLRLELDLSVPKAEMYEPRPDPRQANTLLLLWSAVDRNLADHPISLEWADRREGPWNRIGGDNLPNALPPGVPPMEHVTGGYIWRLPERAPSRVYLKLTARDTAGNAALALTEKPVLIDLSVPETNVLGVVPAAR